MRLQAVEPVVKTYNDSLEIRLGCDLAGYIREDSTILWFDPSNETIGMAGGSKYEVEYTKGVHVAQIGELETMSSKVSSIVISDPELSDSGVYTCRLEGTGISDEVNLTVLEVQGMCWLT